MDKIWSKYEFCGIFWIFFPISLIGAYLDNQYEEVLQLKLKEQIIKVKLSFSRFRTGLATFATPIKFLYSS